MNEAASSGVEVLERPFKNLKLKGLYIDKVITINSATTQSLSEKCCTLAEEIGHYHTSVGNILDQADIRNRKQELRARQWAYQRLIPLSAIIQAHQARVKGRYEIAEFLGVTEEFLQASIDRYQQIYEIYTVCDGYLIYFDPLGVVEIF
ncbi:ImmA/IrrE family metallo-endopeptidase [Paenibacillus sp. MZ03-122A]|uniref:ImmA/IrrE family metallo-endopeptidase n=2 Tax=Paenibacillus TaxID=44249 RepID=A0AAE9L8A6_PAEPO|nr:ImmA/IrrE family metallo-endopeptidase [Paenibacillus sp. MZ03-122A]